MQKLIPAVLLTTAATIITVGGTFAVTHTTASGAATQTTIKAQATKTPAAKKPPASKPTPIATHKYNGPGVDMQWGTVQVTIIVKGNAVTGLSATAPTERARSAYINGIAVPMLRKEVLQARTLAKIKNIYGISGATMTSEAFYQSLLAAVKAAHLK